MDDQTTEIPPARPKGKAALPARLQPAWSALMQPLEQLAPAQLTVPGRGGWSVKDNRTPLAAWAQFRLPYRWRGAAPHAALHVDAAPVHPAVVTPGSPAQGLRNALLGCKGRGPATATVGVLRSGGNQRHAGTPAGSPPGSPVLHDDRSRRFAPSSKRGARRWASINMYARVTPRWNIDWPWATPIIGAQSWADQVWRELRLTSSPTQDQGRCPGPRWSVGLRGYALRRRTTNPPPSISTPPANPSQLRAVPAPVSGRVVSRALRAR
jgi:hypothetical protein